GLVGRLLDPAAQHGVEPLEAARHRQAGGGDILGEAALVLLPDGNLEVLARAEVGEDPARGHAHALGQRADREAFEAMAGGLLEGRIDDGRPGMLALAHALLGPGHPDDSVLWKAR